ncbi:hypothetical protein AWC11_14990 [Mycobacterium interjectum]|nr:hypothetical protein AWC11_14990 [Mycobacterium interjectum]
MELRADSITAVLDDLGIGEAVLVAVDGAFPQSALFAATYPTRTAALIVLEGYADPLFERTGRSTPEKLPAAAVATWSTGEIAHLANPDMPWNEEIRATCSPPCCSPTSSTRRAGRRRWATATGAHCSTRTTL